MPRNTTATNINKKFHIYFILGLFSLEDFEEMHIFKIINIQ